MIGVDAASGKPLSGTAHLVQSIADILMTPIGSRVARREYGSAIFDLFDQPMNGLGRVRLFGAVATALARWEPRLRLTLVRLMSPEEAQAAFADDTDFDPNQGHFGLHLEGTSTEEPDPTALLQLLVPLTARIPA